MSEKKKPKSAALRYLEKRIVGDDSQRLDLLEEERANADIAQKIYDLRTAANLTQTQLAELINTTASVISRIEDSDYEGHSLSMLRRVAAALHKKVVIEFVDDNEEKKAA